MPLAMRYSVDARVGRVGPAPKVPYVGIAGIAFMVQFAAIYIGGALRDLHISLRWMFNLSAVTLLVCAALLYSVRLRPAAPTAPPA